MNYMNNVIKDLTYLRAAIRSFTPEREGRVQLALAEAHITDNSQSREFANALKTLRALSARIDLWHMRQQEFAASNDGSMHAEE